MRPIEIGRRLRPCSRPALPAFDSLDCQTDAAHQGLAPVWPNFGLANLLWSPRVGRVARRRKTVLVRVPASTSNLGSGFDTLGLAVTLYNHVRVTAAAERGIKLVSPIAEEDRQLAEAMVEKAAAEFFARTGKTPFGIAVHCE